MRDQTHTFGVTLNKKRFVVNELDVKADLSFSQTLSTNHYTGGSYQTNPLAGLVSGVPYYIFVNNADLPDVHTRIYRVALNGTYHINKNGSFKVNYLYAKLSTDDYLYQTTGLVNSSGAPTTSGVMPTFEKAPDYRVQAVGVAYIYKF
jgi:predicted porin